VEKIGQSGSFINFNDHKEEFSCPDHEQALKAVLILLKSNKVELSEINKIGHRVVHGGEEFVKPMLITKKNLSRLEKYNRLAPLHNPSNILGIKCCLTLLPQAKNYAVFDTAFHSTLEPKVYMYALPMKLYKKMGIRRYGFHGLSHEYVSHEAAKKLKKPLSKVNIISCHLGSGCSICAIKGGKSVDTSMGFTPLEGLMMSTRSGDLDASIPMFLMREGMTAIQIDSMLNKESGVLGISGFKDMRDVLVAAGFAVSGYKSGKYSVEQKRCSLIALEMFVYRVKKYIGAYKAILGQVDAVVFTAGIGERNQTIRQMIMKDMKMKTIVVPANEELMIARKI
jgi:acetate kinase